MEARIIAILSRGERDAVVRFKTPYGESRGRWVGTPPVLSENYDVELTVGEDFRWGETAVPTEDRRALLQQDQDRVLIQGQIEVAYPNGVAVLRLGDSTVSIKAHGDAPNLGAFVRLYTQQLSLYDSGV